MVTKTSVRIAAMQYRGKSSEAMLQESNSLFGAEILKYQRGQGGDLLPLLLHFALEYTIKKGQLHHEG